MKAWHFVGRGEPLEYVDLPDPVPGVGEVAIDIKACGLCHTDIAMAAGALKGHPVKTPVVLGHEVAGVIAVVGDHVTEYRVGDRVGVWPLVDGHGTGRDGGYAEKTIATIGALVPIPDPTRFEQAAVGTDAGMTSHKAVHTAGKVTSGIRVGIIGLGGLGLIGARLAVIAGADVYAAEPDRQARLAGNKAGALEVFTDVRGFAPLALDVIIDFAGMGTTTVGAIEAIKPGGRIVQVGLTVPEFTISALTLVEKDIELVGSFGGTAKDIAAVYQLFASGQLTSPITTISLRQVPEGLERLERGEVQGRLVMVND
jgi:alcohol dehydrogenase, propanol-preferring